MATAEPKDEEQENYRVIYTYPIVKQSDMPEGRVDPASVFHKKISDLTFHCASIR